MFHKIMPHWLFRKITSSFTNKVFEPVYILCVQVMLFSQNSYNTSNKGSFRVGPGWSCSKAVYKPV